MYSTLELFNTQGTQAKNVLEFVMIRNDSQRFVKTLSLYVMQ